MFFQDDNLMDIGVGLYDDIDDIEGDIINTISIEEYDNLFKDIEENNLKIFNPYFNMTCVKCRKSVETTLEVGSIISKFGIGNLYEQYVDISTYTSMTKADTDSMIPFEREIFMGLIQKKEDDKGK